MDYLYEGSGGISVGGCVRAVKRIFYIFKYAPGTTLYLCYKAKRGVLERITIKKINVIANSKTGYIPTPIYVDTYNALYNEWDLCTESNAVALATAFYEKQLALAQDLIRKCPNGG